MHQECRNLALNSWLNDCYLASAVWSLLPFLIPLLIAILPTTSLGFWHLCISLTCAQTI